MRRPTKMVLISAITILVVLFVCYLAGESLLINSGIVGIGVLIGFAWSYIRDPDRTQTKENFKTWLRGFKKNA